MTRETERSLSPAAPTGNLAKTVLCGGMVQPVSICSQIKWVQPDDCRLVADNSGSFANNPGLTPSIDALNSGREIAMIASRSDYDCRLLHLQT